MKLFDDEAAEAWCVKTTPTSWPRRGLAPAWSVLISYLAIHLDGGIYDRDGSPTRVSKG